MTKLFEALAHSATVSDTRSRQHFKECVQYAWRVAQCTLIESTGTLGAGGMAGALIHMDDTSRIILLGSRSNSDTFIGLTYQAQSAYMNIIKADPVSLKLRTRLNSLHNNQQGF